MSRIHLTKEYERDLSLIIEGLWAENLVKIISERLSIKIPHEIFVIFYVTSENLQIWENTEALDWYKNCLLEENTKSSAFIENIVSEYLVVTEKIKNISQNGTTTDKIILEKYINLLSEAISLFSVWYYSLVNEKTPKNIRERLLRLRSTDEFFADNDNFIKDCLENLGVNRDLSNLLFPEEFPNSPIANALQERAKGVISIMGKENHIATLVQFALKHPEYLFEGLSNDTLAIQEIYGQIAFKGRINGNVKIVKNKKKMEEIQNGDILVSPMTTPDFLPAMKKAAAFVTDEGGITCHAAIIARELKKPCIIGTKIATQVLKDGDLVEVDADNGIVRIIKKAN